jgi:hypothetical protein
MRVFHEHKNAGLVMCPIVCQAKEKFRLALDWTFHPAENSWEVRERVFQATGKV